MLEAQMRRIRRRRTVTLKPFGLVGADELRVSLGDRSASVADRLVNHFHGVPAVEVFTAPTCGTIPSRRIKSAWLVAL
jgi:hypothetical protein